MSQTYENAGLTRIPAGGGPPTVVAGVGNGEVALALPQILPGGQAVLFTADAGQGVDKTTIEVLTLADGRRTIVARGGNSPRYLPTSGRTGHLVYVNKAVLFAVPFDLDRLETHGTAVPVLDDVAFQPQYGTAHFDVSRTGTLVYRRVGASASASTTLQWVEPSGKKEPLRAQPGDYSAPSVSPDGTRIALRVGQGRSDIWVYEPQRDAMTRLTFGGALYLYPRWSPDGRYVVFANLGNGLMQTRADGAGQPQTLTESKTIQIPRSFTPDGKRLAYSDSSDTGGTGGGITRQMWTVPLEDQGGRLTAGTPEPFLKSSFSDGAPAFSPDGRWLAYQSNESGKNEIYVRAFPPPASGQGGKWQISNGGGALPLWSQSGRELVYQSGDQIMSAAYTAKGDTFMAEKPRVWIAKLGAAEVSGSYAWDLAPDGKRVVVVTSAESSETAPKQEHEVVFLQNFFDELRRRVPLGK